MKTVDPRAVHEAMQGALVDDRLYRQARAAIKAVLAALARLTDEEVREILSNERSTGGAS